MPRPNRNAPGGLPFHVLNRAVGRRKVFESPADYMAFGDAVSEALRTRPMRICSYCVMPNHWHMVLWPKRDGELSAFVQHLRKKVAATFFQRRRRVEAAVATTRPRPASRIPAGSGTTTIESVPVALLKLIDWLAAPVFVVQTPALLVNVRSL
jgi:REP element-mobilizing transposase RayT